MIELDIALFVTICFMCIIGFLCVLGIAIYIALPKEESKNDRT